MSSDENSGWIKGCRELCKFYLITILMTFMADLITVMTFRLIAFLEKNLNLLTLLALVVVVLIYAICFLGAYLGALGILFGAPFFIFAFLFLLLMIIYRAIWILSFSHQHTLINPRNFIIIAGFIVGTGLTGWHFYITQ